MSRKLNQSPLSMKLLISDDEPTAQEDSSSDANNKETDSNEDKKES